MAQLINVATAFVSEPLSHPQDALLVSCRAKALKALHHLLFAMPVWPMLASMNKIYPGDAILRRAHITDIVVEHLDTMALDFSHTTGCGYFANIVFGFLDPTPFRSLCPPKAQGFRNCFQEPICLYPLQRNFLSTACIYVLLMSSAFKPNPAVGHFPVICDLDSNSPPIAHDPSSGYQESIEAFTVYLMNNLGKEKRKMPDSYQELSTLLPFPKTTINGSDVTKIFAGVLTFLAVENNVDKNIAHLEIADGIIEAAINDGGNFVLRKTSSSLKQDRDRVQNLISVMRSLEYKVEPRLQKTLLVIGLCFKILYLNPSLISDAPYHGQLQLYLKVFETSVSSALITRGETQGGELSTFEMTAMLLSATCATGTYLGDLCRVCVEVLGDVMSGSLCEML